MLPCRPMPPPGRRFSSVTNSLRPPWTTVESAEVSPVRCLADGAKWFPEVSDCLAEIEFAPVKPGEPVLDQMQLVMCPGGGVH
jgi:hypothetical protein